MIDTGGQTGIHTINHIFMTNLPSTDFDFLNFQALKPFQQCIIFSCNTNQIRKIYEIGCERSNGFQTFKSTNQEN